MNATDSLSGHLLIAMPGMGDPRFTKSVIYLCVHNEEGAMGLVINRLVENLCFSDLLKHLRLNNLENVPDIPIHYGGPVEGGRGFVLHCTDYIFVKTICTW